MALTYHGHRNHYRDDHRAHLIGQNQPPIAYEIEGLHFKRLGALARACLVTLAGWGRSLYRAIYTAKCHRLQRELMWYGIPYSHLLEDSDESGLSDKTHNNRERLP